jgi:hypothetical protein
MNDPLRTQKYCPPEIGAIEASSEMTVYTERVESQAMMKPYKRPEGPPLLKP